MDISLVHDFGSSFLFVGNWHWDFSNDRNFVKNWSGNRNRSLNWNSLNNRILNMMNFLFFVVFLNNWLSNNFLTRHLNSLSSSASLIHRFLNNWVHSDSLIRLSVKFHINFLSLDNWLNESLVIDFLGRLLNSFNSVSVLSDDISDNWVLSENLRLRRNKVDFFFVVDNSFFINWLSKNFFSRSLKIFNNLFSGENSVFSLGRIVDHLRISSDNIKSFNFSVNSGLNELFSNGNLTGNIHFDSFVNYFFVNDWIFVFSLSIHRSGNNFLSNNGSLNDSLFDDWLLYNSLGDDWLRDDFSGDHRLRNNLLGLGDDGFGIHHLRFHHLGFGHLNFSSLNGSSGSTLNSDLGFKSSIGISSTSIHGSSSNHLSTISGTIHLAIS